MLTRPHTEPNRMRAFMRGAFARIVDFALPPLCPSCDELLGDGVGLCATCWSKLSFIEPPYCARLGIPFTYDPGPGLLSMEAIAAPPAYDRARAVVRYDDIARALVHAYKYGDQLDLAPLMGGWMARAGRELLQDADALIPVPLHWRRLWARRFNQSAALATAISSLCGVPVSHTGLKRVRATAQQVGLSKAERAENVQGAFRVPPDGKAEISGRRLVLIDDVLTSGATADTCARLAAGRGGACRCAGFRAGCGTGAHAHIIGMKEDVKTMPPVEIYTTRFCPYCIVAKALLTRKGVEFKEINISADITRRDEMIERANGRMTVPQIFIGSVHVGGSDELRALERAGKLDALLEGEGQSA
jgi:GrxC family glutaredoxin